MKSLTLLDSQITECANAASDKAFKNNWENSKGLDFVNYKIHKDELDLFFDPMLKALIKERKEVINSLLRG